MTTGGSISSSDGRLAVLSSPDDVPCSRRFTHGARYSLAHLASSRRAATQAAPGHGGHRGKRQVRVERVAPVLGDRDAEYLAGAQRDPLVRLPGQVQPVG